MERVLNTGGDHASAVAGDEQRKRCHNQGTRGGIDAPDGPATWCLRYDNVMMRITGSSIATRNGLTIIATSPVFFDML